MRPFHLILERTIIIIIGNHFSMIVINEIKEKELCEPPNHLISLFYLICKPNNVNHLKHAFVDFTAIALYK